MSTTKGFTLVEAIVASSILLVVIAAATPVALRSLSATDDVQDRMTATLLAQEGIDLVRQQRDTNGIGALSGGNAVFDKHLDPCVNNACRSDGGGFTNCGEDGCPPLRLTQSGQYRYDVGSNTEFIRTIRVIQADIVTDGSLQDTSTTPPTRGESYSIGSDGQDDVIEVESSVSYTTRGGITSSVTLRTYLHDIWKLDY